MLGGHPNLLIPPTLECCHVTCSEREPLTTNSLVCKAAVPAGFYAFRVVGLDDVDMLKLLRQKERTVLPQTLQIIPTIDTYLNTGFQSSIDEG